MEPNQNKSSVEQVREFHDLFQAGTAKDVPTFPQSFRAQLRSRLIFEELEEFKTAYMKGDIVEVLDALSDLQYVLDGTYVEFGLASVKGEAFKRVHESNMSKADNTFERAQLTMHYHRELGYVCSIKRIGDSYVCIREDGKVLKSLFYTPVDLKDLVTTK